MKKLFASAIMAAAALTAGAQSLNTGYFLDNFAFGHRYNAAFQPEQDVTGIFGIALDNLSITGQSNLGASSFFFPIDGKMVNGLNKNVPADEFLNKLKDVNNLNLNIDENLLTLGSRIGKNGFINFEANLKANVHGHLSKELFKMLKCGVGDGQGYSIENLNVFTSDYAEFALGYSHRIGEKLQIGVRAKALVGLAYANAQVDKLMLETTDYKLYATGQGKLNVASQLLAFENGGGAVQIDKFKFGKPGTSGFGVAFDLGVTYKPIKGLTIDASVADLGSISWKETTSGQMKYNKKEVDVSSGDIDPMEFFRFDEQSLGSIKESLSATYRIGARYQMPFYDKLSAGLLGTFKTGTFAYSDIRVGATVTPVKPVSLTATCGFTSFGTALGAALNLSLGNICLFVGADSLFGKVTPQFIPVNPFSTSVSAGLVFQINRKN